MRLGITQNNPTTLVTMPVKLARIEDDDEKLENYFSREELQQFFNCLDKEESQKWYTLFRILAFAGTRKGETLAITWEDFNFVDNTLNINKTLTYGLDYKIIVQPPKTRKSKRLIHLDEQTIKVVKDWRSAQAIEMLKFGYNTMDKKQLVFSNSKNQFINPQKIGQKLDSLIKKYDLKRVTPREFRHTHCSILFVAGATIKEVQDRLGHSDIKTTMNIYAHVTKNVKEQTAEKFAKYVNF